MKKLLILVTIVIFGHSVAMEQAQPRKIKSLVNLALPKAIQRVDLKDKNFKYLELPTKLQILALKINEIKQWNLDEIMDFIHDNPSIELIELYEDIIKIIPDKLFQALLNEQVTFTHFLYEINKFPENFKGLFKIAFADAIQKNIEKNIDNIFLYHTKKPVEAELPFDLKFIGLFAGYKPTIHVNEKFSLIDCIVIFMGQEMQNVLIKNLLHTLSQTLTGDDIKNIISPNVEYLFSKMLPLLKKFSSSITKEYIEKLAQGFNKIKSTTFNRYNTRKLIYNHDKKTYEM